MNKVVIVVDGGQNAGTLRPNFAQVECQTFFVKDHHEALLIAEDIHASLILVDTDWVKNADDWVQLKSSLDVPTIGMTKHIDDKHNIFDEHLKKPFGFTAVQHLVEQFL